MNSFSRLRRWLLVSLVLFLACATQFACSSGSSDSVAFVVRNTSQSVAGTTPVEISGTLFAFLADEATYGVGGTPLNTDGDRIDSVAVVVNTTTQAETNLAVAALELEWVGSTLFLVVDEALDGVDWDAIPGLGSHVLLHWQEGMMAPALVATVAPVAAPRILGVSTRLYYHNATTPVGAFQSNLFFVDSAAPTVPVPVTTQDAIAELTVKLLGQDEGMLFCSVDETAEGRILNNDGDMLDTDVLTLLDGTDVTASMRSVALAVPTGTPFRALSTGANDWLVAFLVSEAAQGATNFNDPVLFAGTWQPVQCNTFEDGDAIDSVLHYLKFADWDLNPGLNPPVNTGLVGTTRIVALPGTDGFVGTISTEADEGTCDLNSDGDTADFILRYVQATTPILPPGGAANLHALANTIPGGTQGVAELDGRFVIVVDEAADDADYDGDPGNDNDLIAWATPSAAGLDVAFQFNHAAGGTPVFFRPSWARELVGKSRMVVAIAESPGNDFNDDGDVTDSVPTFPDFVAGPRLNFPGATIAVNPTNAGAILTKGITYFRVSEMADGRDWNGDLILDDVVLVRLSEGVGSPVFVSELNTLARSAVEVASNEALPTVVVFVVEETMVGLDLNGDNDANDRMLRYLRQ